MLNVTVRVYGGAAPPQVASNQSSRTATVTGFPTIDRQLVVRPDGRISLDLIGDVFVEGKTVDEIRGDISERLKAFIVSPDVSVTLRESRSRTYYVFGYVSRPGAYPLVGRVTAVDALARANGPTIFASPNASRLVRGNGEAASIYAVKYKSITEFGDPKTNYELQPGDIIYVPARTSAQIGFALQMIFFPIQQVIGLGAQSITTVMLP
jgi:polysaccharide export outer membrane protein